MSENKIYPTAVDIWLVALIAITTIGCLMPGIYLVTSNDAAGWVLIRSGLLTGVTSVLFGVPCYYEVTQNAIVVRFGLIKKITLHDKKSTIGSRFQGS